MYRNHGLFLLKHLVVAFINSCTVKLVLLHSLIRFKLALVIAWSAEVKPKNLKKARIILTFMNIPKQKKNEYES